MVLGFNDAVGERAKHFTASKADVSSLPYKSLGVRVTRRAQSSSFTSVVPYLYRGSIEQMTSCWGLIGAFVVSEMTQNENMYQKHV